MHPFLKDVLDKVPEADRQTVAAILDRSDVDSAITPLIDGGVKRQSDYSRGMDDLRKKGQEIDDLKGRLQTRYEEQTQWYETNKPVLEAGRKALEGRDPAGPDPARPTHTELPPDVMRRADVEKFVTERELSAANFIAATTALSTKHLHEFGEVLNVLELLADPTIGKVGLQGVYDAKFGDRYQKKASEAEQKRIDTLVSEGVQKALRERVNPAFPSSPRPEDASPLDVLTAKTPDPSQFSVEAAADEYTQLAARRSA